MAQILVVDKNRGYQAIIRAILDKEHHKSTVVGGAASALLELMESSFDLLLVDSEFSYDLLRTCADRWLERIPPGVVIMTPAGQPDFRTITQTGLASFHMPVLHWLQKPFSIEMLCRSVRIALSSVTEDKEAGMVPH